jgi:hypothetical protein
MTCEECVKRAKIKAIDDEYNKIEAKAYAKYVRDENKLWAVYEVLVKPALDAYKKGIAPARRKYESKIGPIWERYEKETAKARKSRDKKLKVFK